MQAYEATSHTSFFANGSFCCVLRFIHSIRRGQRLGDVRGGVEANMADMFSCCLSAQELEDRNRSKRIDKMLSKEKSLHRRQVKILLLGSGESGKSTFLKQMRIIHGHDFDEEQIAEFRNIIYTNVIKGCMVLCDARQKLGIAWDKPENEKNAKFLFGYNNSMVLDATMFSDFATVSKLLWQDKGIKEAFERRNEYQLVSSTVHFTQTEVYSLL